MNALKNPRKNCLKNNFQEKNLENKTQEKSERPKRKTKEEKDVPLGGGLFFIVGISEI